MDESSITDVYNYLQAHEEDIALSINDFGDLAGVFRAMFGRHAKATIINTK